MRAEALEASGVGVSEDAGKETGDAVDDDGGCQLTAGQDVVADGEFAVAELFVDALIDTFVAAAKEDDAVERGKVVGDGLGVGAALGGEQDDGFAGRIAGRLRREVEGVEAVEDWPGFEDHAFATAKGPVVDSLMAVVGEGAEVVQVDARGAGGEGAGEDAVIKESCEEAGEDGEDIEAHVGGLWMAYGQKSTGGVVKQRNFIQPGPLFKSRRDYI